MKNCLYLLICLAFVQLSCSKDKPNEPPGVRTLPQDRGTKIITFVSGYKPHTYDLIWSKNTNELIWADGKVLKALDLQSYSTRVIDDSAYMSVPTWSHKVKLSDDGSELYYVQATAKDRSLFCVSLSGENRQLLLNKVSQFCLSPTNRHIAYKTDGDSLLIYCMDDSSKIFVSTGDPKTFSSDGTKLLYKSGSGCFIFTLESQISELLPLEIDHYIHSYYWGENGIYIIYLEEAAWHEGKGIIRNISTNDTLFTWDPWVSDYLPYFPDRFTWNSEGNKVACWRVERLEGGFWPGEPGYYQHNLQLIDIGLKSNTRIANGHCEEDDSGAIAISPDNTKIAYILDWAMYMRDLP